MYVNRKTVLFIMSHDSLHM